MKNVKDIVVEVKGKDWQSALDGAFKKNKKDIKMDGFRKGCVPKDIYIKKAGIESLFMDAADIVIEKEYDKIFEDKTLDVVCQPSVSIESIDKDSIKLKFTLISRPEVKLGKYKNLGVKKESVKVTKEEVEHEIGHILEHMAEMVVKEDGKVEKGDTAVIDFEGVVDGEKLEGGTGTNYSLEIGSNTFIPGFEDGLIGMKKDEKKILKLKFPEDYTDDLKGKDVEFTVTVREIQTRVQPKMDKDFFLDLGIEGVDSKESLEKNVKEELQKQKEQEADDKFVDELLKAATEDLKVEINEEIIDDEAKALAHQMSHDLEMRGFTLDKYLAMTGTKMDDFMVTLRPQAINRLKVRYLLEEIVKAEKIEVTKEEIKEKVKDEAEKYGMKEKEFLDAIGGDEAIKYEIEMLKAIDILKES